VFDDMLKKPCSYHKTPVNHTLKQCDLLKRYYSRANAKDGEAKKDGGDGDAGGFPAVENVFLISVTWPFAVWGLDIVGPLRKALGGYTHLLVAIDKFSKWVEVRPITNLRAEQAVTFFTDIVYRLGVPNSIITDNGSQFTGRKFLEFYDKFHIRVDWAVVAHPQTNGQVERANGMILQGLKPRIFDRQNKSGRKWLQELPAVVWSLRTTPSRATGFTPFFLVYGAEAILPTDLEYGSPRVRGYDEGTNQRAREDSLDQLDEARTVALMHSARYQQALRRYQARKVRRRDFSEGTWS
jgi:transposase InsO family protein